MFLAFMGGGTWFSSSSWIGWESLSSRFLYELEDLNGSTVNIIFAYCKAATKALHSTRLNHVFTE